MVSYPLLAMRSRGRPRTSSILNLELISVIRFFFEQNNSPTFDFEGVLCLYLFRHTDHNDRQTCDKKSNLAPAYLDPTPSFCGDEEILGILVIDLGIGKVRPKYNGDNNKDYLIVEV